MLCNESDIQAICSRMAPDLNRAMQHVQLGVIMEQRRLKNKIFTTLEVTIENLVRREVVAWLRRKLEQLEPFRKVIIKKLRKLIDALYVRPSRTTCMC